MTSDDIVIGEHYRFNAPSIKSGGYEAKKVYQDASGEWLVDAKNAREAHVRTFKLSQMITSVRKKSDVKIVTESTKKIGEVYGHEMWIERIDSWPVEQRRGRPRKLVDA